MEMTPRSRCRRDCAKHAAALGSRMPKILYLVTEDWFFCQHFLPMGRAAKAAGFDVVVATRVRAHGATLAAEGFRVVPLESERRSLAPLELLRGLVRMRRIVADERPDVTHCIALRMVVLGGLAAKAAGCRRLILAPTGLGHLWIDDGPVTRVARAVTRAVVGRVLRGPGTRFLFENADDPREFGLDPLGSDVTLVGGAGVDPAQIVAAPEPEGPVKAAVVARMLKPKGIPETVAAARAARAQGAPIELHLFGAPDPSNPTSLTEADLRAMAGDGVFWHGPTADVAAVWRDHHVAVLLSHREGLPRSLVEAAAAGRPIITTDVTGCREVVRDGIEGVLVRRGDVAAAAAALARLAGDGGLRQRMGQAARARFLAGFTTEAVMRTVGRLYRDTIAGGTGGPAAAGDLPSGQERA